MKKITTKQITATALLLAICILSQYFKNLSVYITGPIVNAVLIIAALGVGLGSGILISIIAPITAFFFTGSPIMAAIPLMFPTIMLGNIILVVCAFYFNKMGRQSAASAIDKKKSSQVYLPAGLVIGSILKSAFMGIVVIYVLFPLFGENIASNLPKPEMLPKILAAAKITFSVTQLITSFIGSFLAFLIWIPLKRALKNDSTM